ncbi:DUF2637 domain-containing protein [Streptomyces sp. NPDC050504]|uniref:DUF2637 domain-containing protein n=1 Tax=Streptomyces sp. NPDC050504 TaxID=3365618 RepID=UPI0037A2CAD9
MSDTSAPVTPGLRNEVIRAVTTGTQPGTAGATQGQRPPGHTASQARGTVDGRGPDDTRALHRRPSRWPFVAGAAAVGLVALLGWVWSFVSLTDFVAHVSRGDGHADGFSLPWIFPLVVDGLAIAMSVTIWQAAMDARPALAARLVLAGATAGSVYFNIRHAGTVSDARAVAAWSPLAANLAFEFLLQELRTSILRSRGMPGRTPLPRPHPLRWILAPAQAFTEWRSLVLRMTVLEAPCKGPGTPRSTVARSHPAQAAPAARL